MLCRADHASDCQKRRPSLLIQHLADAILDRCQKFLQTPVRLAPRITDRNRSIVGDGKLQHLFQFPTVFRRHHAHIRHRGEKCQIKNTLMRLPIASDQSRAIHAEHNRKILDTDIVNDLIICPL